MKRRCRRCRLECEHASGVAAPHKCSHGKSCEGYVLPKGTVAVAVAACVNCRIDEARRSVAR